MTPIEIKENREWAEFYGRPLTLKRYLWRIVNHLEFLYNIIQCKPKKAVEIGIGTAAHSFFVSHFVSLVVAVDNDLSIIKFAKTSNKYFGKPVKFVVADAFNLPFKNNSFDLFFSQGFMEHFNEKEINKLAKEQLNVAVSIIFSIPSLYYGIKDFGNEMLLKRKEWLKILKLKKGKEIFIAKAKYSFIDVRLLEFFMLKKWDLKPMEIVIYTKNK
ncbi:MAG: class I SAM-dependent methyltransferase [bacterium]